MKRALMMAAIVACALFASVGTGFIVSAQEAAAPAPAAPAEAAPAPAETAPAASAEATPAPAEAAPAPAEVAPAPAEAASAPVEVAPAPAEAAPAPAEAAPAPVETAPPPAEVAPAPAEAAPPPAEATPAPAETAPAPAEAVPAPAPAAPEHVEPVAKEASVDGKDGIVNYDALIGRKAVESGLAAETGMIRFLPQSCPPFALRDEFGKIIDPNFEPDVQRPVSARETCAPCHDVNTITQGYHFQMGYNEMAPEAKAGQADPLHKSPGLYGKWQLLYQRELAPKHFIDPAQIDLTPFEWITNCGICHPGGGPGEFDRAGKRYSDIMGADAAAETSKMTGKRSDYFEAPWNETGVEGPDCFVCHMDTYDYSLRVQQIKKWNFKWSTTLAADFGVVEGSVKDVLNGVKTKDANGVEIDSPRPSIKWRKELFGPDGKVALKIRRPTDRQCVLCHDISGVQKRGTTWHSSYVQDVHTEQNITCIQCHPGDIRHNFAKGHSANLSTRDDLDGSMKSCQECHYAKSMGAPNYTHLGIPPLHFKRLSCESCHITRRPFLAVRVADSTTGKVIELPNSGDVGFYDNYRFNAHWGRLEQTIEESSVIPYSPEELDKAVNYRVPVDVTSPFRTRWLANADLAALPEGEFVVGQFLKDNSKDPEIILADTPEKRAVMLLALEAIRDDATAHPAVVMFRGQVWSFHNYRLEDLGGNFPDGRPRVTLQPYRTSRIDEYRVPVNIFKNMGEINAGKENDLGLYYPEGYQLGVFWAYVNKDTGEGKPLFLSDMEAATNFLNGAKYTLYPAGATSEGTALQIYDDNNDRWKEVNTEDEMKTMGWAVKHTLNRLDNIKYDLYYIKGVHAYRVDVTDTLPDNLDELVTAAPVAEDQPRLTVAFKTKVKNEDGAEQDKDVVASVAPFDATVTQIEDPATVKPIGELAQRLEWTISHGVEPSTQAIGLGVKGCVDCHSEESVFFNTPVMLDPFGPDGRPEMVPAREVMGISEEQLKYSHIREVLLKEQGHWIIIIALALIAFHFVFFGPRDSVPVSGTYEGSVRFFRFYERFAYWGAAGCVGVLGMSAVGFRLTGQTAVGHFVRVTHHYMGIAGAVMFALFFLLLLPYMIPRGYDFNWSWRRKDEVRPPRAGKFTAGEKLLYWSLSAMLVGVAVTGLIIYRDYDIRTNYQQYTYMLHDLFAVLAVCLIFVHGYMMIFLTPQGLRRVFGGRVSRAWAEYYRSEWRPGR